jgi:uncharacterized protein
MGRSQARSNRAKHRVDFADAATVFDDPRALTIPSPLDAEERFVTLGIDATGRLVVVVYTWRGDTIRIISARQATRNEVRDYEETQ